MTTSAAVVFSKIHLIGGAIGHEVISRKCFCTPGKKPQQINNTECEEVTHALFGETIRNFVGQWDTKHLHSLAAKRELTLWGSFFAAPRSFSQSAKKMAIQRNLSDRLIFEAEVLGDGNQVSKASEKSFDMAAYNQDETALSATLEKDTDELETNGFKTKDKVAIYIQSSVAPANAMECSPRVPFSSYLKNNSSAFGFFFINPLAVKYFSLTPSVCKMTQIVDAGGFAIIQHFAEPETGSTKTSEVSASQAPLKANI